MEKDSGIASGIITLVFGAKIQINVKASAKSLLKIDKHNAIHLRSVNIKGFEVARQIVPLPSQSFVQKEVGFFHVEPGQIIVAIREFVKHLKTLPNWKTIHAIISISFDDMKVGNLAMFDQKTESCIGPHEYAFLVNIRSIFGTWRLPFFTAFDFKPTKEWYLEIVTALYVELDLTVVLSTCDQGKLILSNCFNLALLQMHFIFCCIASAL